MKSFEKSEFKFTTNNYVYNRLIKAHREHTGEIDCSWCPYHKHENLTRKWRRRNWKWYRKTQYKF